MSPYTDPINGSKQRLYSESTQVKVHQQIIELRFHIGLPEHQVLGDLLEVKALELVHAGGMIEGMIDELEVTGV